MFYRLNHLWVHKDLDKKTLEETEYEIANDGRRDGHMTRKQWTKHQIFQSGYNNTFKNILAFKIIQTNELAVWHYV